MNFQYWRRQKIIWTKFDREWCINKGNVIMWYACQHYFHAIKEGQNNQSESVEILLSNVCLKTTIFSVVNLFTSSVGSLLFLLHFSFFPSLVAFSNALFSFGQILPLQNHPSFLAKSCLPWSKRKNPNNWVRVCVITN